jgi:uncharacterized protein (DUF488 family)
MKLYTIGHGNLELEPFLDILRENDVRWLADIRSAPYSRMFPWFNKASLAESLEDVGIRYLFLGDKIGGKPREGEGASEWKQGKLNPTLVSSLSQTRRWKDGVTHLARVVTTMDEEGETGCLLCSEKNPNNCHRSLVSFQMETVVPGLTIEHLAHDSAAREAKFQGALFAEGTDERSDYH